MRRKKMLKATTICCLFFMLAQQVKSYGQTRTLKKEMASLISENFRFAAHQYKLLMKAVPADSMPRSFESGLHVNSDTKWWCSGFYPGALLYIYEATGDANIKGEAIRRLAVLEKEKHYRGNHDLGFMMFCSFGNAYAILKDPSYKAVIFTAARSLASRYRSGAGVIQSWNRSKKWQCPVIIDNMMNLELLEWTSWNGGDAVYKQIAETHANNTMEHHFRPNYSSYHVIDYDLNTGMVRSKATAQGQSDSSSWARGQGWALYGYTMMYRFTKNRKYLDQARGIAGFILNHPRLPGDGIPYWDFDALGIPGALRDASAGAIYASGLLELGLYTSGSEKKKYIAAAERILRSLSSVQYRAKKGSNGGFLLKHSVGALPLKSEVDVPLTYADYYFLEALKRYKQWYL